MKYPVVSAVILFSYSSVLASQTLVFKPPLAVPRVFEVPVLTRVTGAGQSSARPGGFAPDSTPDSIPDNATVAVAGSAVANQAVGRAIVGGAAVIGEPVRMAVVDSAVVGSAVVDTAVVERAVVATAIDAGTRAATAPPISLAKRYKDGVEVSGYLVSEKYDGVRVWWNGRHLLSRGGNIYRAPGWFTDALPKHILDGELWMGRGQFQRLMQTVRDQVPDEDAWRSVRFMVFDAPQIEGGFQQRQRTLEKILSTHPSAWVQRVKQHQLTNQKQLQQMLAQVTEGGGEGLILQRADAAYISGRHAGMLKLKPHHDAEARVTGYVPGKGKYTGMTGSLIVVDAEGRRFRLGSGLSDADRKAPPAIGALVTYRYQGRTQSGKPRFARYLRVRPAE